ncbi:prepilin peptidase [Thermotalea metallivorans]|nr:A24 family peptidase [Thermotalea metallivorans]
MKENGFSNEKTIDYVLLFFTLFFQILLYDKYGFQDKFFIYFLLILLLIQISFIDMKQKIIPNKLNILVALIGFINILLNIKHGLNYFLAGFVAGGIFLFLALITKGGIGGGDIKLFASLGMILGLYPTILVIAYTFIFASILCIGLMIAKKATFTSTIALAPFINIATLYYLLT